MDGRKKFGHDDDGGPSRSFCACASDATAHNIHSVIVARGTFGERRSRYGYHFGIIALMPSAPFSIAGALAGFFDSIVLAALFLLIEIAHPPGIHSVGRTTHLKRVREFTMKRPTLAALGLLLALPALAFAQQNAVQQREVKGKPDTDINAGLFATIRKDCTAGPLPAVRLVTPPAHGKVTVKQGKLRATNIKNCLGMELPAFVAIYRSAHDFIGQDRFTLEVVGSNGKTQVHQVTVTVMQSGHGQGI